MSNIDSHGQFIYKLKQDRSKIQIQVRYGQNVVSWSLLKAS